MASGYGLETAFVRGCAKTYASEIGFSPEAEVHLDLLRLGWSDALQVLRIGRVVWSDKTEADGAVCISIGTTCDGERLRLTVRWDANCYRMLVVEHLKRL